MNAKLNTKPDTTPRISSRDTLLQRHLAAMGLVKSAIDATEKIKEKSNE